MARELGPFERERILHGMMVAYNNSEPISSTSLEALENELTDAQIKQSTETLAIYRTRTHFQDGKIIHAYKTLAAALSKDPHNLLLQLERLRMLDGMQEQLLFLLTKDLHNPSAEALYGILAKEGWLNAGHHCGYLSLLVAEKRWQEAIELAIPLVELYPSILSYKEAIGIIAKQTLHPRLLEAVRVRQEDELGGWVSKPPSGAEAYELLGNFSRLNSMINHSHLNEEAVALLKKVIGTDPDSSEYEIELKEFYFIKGTLEERLGSALQAVLTFKKLVQLDSCRLEYRSALDRAMHSLSLKLSEESRTESSKVDLIGLYPVLIEIGFLGYGLLTLVCKAEVKAGRSEQAKFKMQQLVALNTYDFDYLKAASEVAELMNDVAWLQSLDVQMQKVSQIRPWNLALCSYLENRKLKAIKDEK
ncbi:MAG: hypothetical protein J0L82_10320 [Deltaproteobacteria bacterium]|jgi:tetratricopeptide (TPR) repeat protein|nr:hypothetical protein [Deltaproteobacteria bacterium]